MKTVAQLPILATKSKVWRILADIGLVAEVDLECIVEKSLDRWGRLMKSDVVKTVEETFEDGLQSSYLDSCNGLKTAMFNFVEHALAGNVRSGRGNTVNKSELCCLVQSKTVPKVLFVRPFPA